MAQAALRSGPTPPPHTGADEALGGEAARKAFIVALEGVLVESPAPHVFAGAIERDVAHSIWAWIARDIAPVEVARLGDSIGAGADPIDAIDLLVPEIIDRLKDNAEAEKDNFELERRNTMQMGGEAARRRLPQVIMALRRRPVLAQAARFGSAIGSLADETALAEAFQSIAITNPLTRALWMQAMVGHMGNPGRAMAAAVAIAGGNTQTEIIDAGYGALVEAILSHAQSQVRLLVMKPGRFADIDMACRAIERFHRLMRALTYTLEIERHSHWGKMISDLVGQLSERLERPMKEIPINVAQALRRPRDSDRRIDADQVLAALNGLYLLTAVRRSRDSLAVNALLDQAWTETGQTIEVLVTRALEHYRHSPANALAREWLDVGITMAEIRFNSEYADILRRARDGAERRTIPS